MVDWFDDKGFEQYYLSSAKAKNLQSVWIIFGLENLKQKS